MEGMTERRGVKGSVGQDIETTTKTSFDIINMGYRPKIESLGIELAVWKASDYLTKINF